MAPLRVTKSKLLGTLGVVFFGLTALFSVVELGPLVSATFVIGFFIVLPLVAILGDDLPMVVVEDADESEATRHTERTPPGTESSADRPEEDPVALLRERYAQGEIGDEAFERRLERLLETENLEGVVGTAGTADGRALDRELELERDANHERDTEAGRDPERERE